MLINGSQFAGTHILSLHVGGPITQVAREIIDPHNLQVIAFELYGGVVGNQPGIFLDTSSIREVSSDGFIIDSDDEFVSQGDIIKLDNAMKLNFQPIGLRVETKKGAKLGKVIDFLVDASDFRIYQFVVKRPVLKAFKDPELIINRNQIIEVNDYKIVIKKEKSSSQQSSPVQTGAFMPNFINPFRKSPLSPAQNQSPDVPDTV